MKGNDMEQFIVKRDGKRDLKFAGEKLATVSSSANNARSDYSGSPGRWTELTLYRTAAGKYVCSQIGYTSWQGEKDRYSGQTCDAVDQIQEFFGHGWLAKELYEAADIDTTEHIE
jgi:hypothetical protein